MGNSGGNPLVGCQPRRVLVLPAFAGWLGEARLLTKPAVKHCATRLVSPYTYWRTPTAITASKRLPLPLS
jgi:hypothetical protein